MSTPLKESELKALKSSKGQGEWQSHKAACMKARGGKLPTDWAEKVEATNLRDETMRREPPKDAKWAKNLARGQRKAKKPSHVRTVEEQAASSAEFDAKPARERRGELEGKLAAGELLDEEQTAELQKLAS